MKTWLKIVLAAIAFTVIAQVLHTISSILTMSYYLDENYFPVWSKIMMPAAGPPPAEFYYYSIAASFIIGLIFSAVYAIINPSIKGKGIWKGLHYGVGLFLVVGIPYFLTNLLLINLPLGLQVTWLLIDGLVAYMIAGIAIAKICKES